MQAREGAWVLGGGADGSAGVGGRGTVGGVSCQLGRASPPRPLRGAGTGLPITGNREGVGRREAVGGARSSGEGRDNRTRLERTAVAPSVDDGGWEELW